MKLTENLKRLYENHTNEELHEIRVKCGKRTRHVNHKWLGFAETYVCLDCGATAGARISDGWEE